MDKFKRFGLTPAPAKRVTPSLVAECFANLECKIIDTRLVNEFNHFVLEVPKAWTENLAPPSYSVLRHQIRRNRSDRKISTRDSPPVIGPSYTYFAVFRRPTKSCK